MDKPKAKLINAHIEDWGGHGVAIGVCTEHEARPDLVGRVIHTSGIVAINGNEVETRNSLYTVEWEEPQEDAK